MRFVVAALCLILFQQCFWRTAELPSSPEAVESLLGGATSTADPVELSGRVVDASPTWGDGVRLGVKAESADGRPTSGLVSVSLRQTSRRWRTGDRLQLRSRLRRISSFGNFGELDWAAYNARRGIFASAYAWRDEDVTPLPAADGVIDSLRRRFAQACERRGGQGAELLEALVIGDRTGIDRSTSDAVRDAGLAHFLAISGSHMALIVAVVVAGVRAAAGLSATLLERYDVLRAAAVLGALAVLAYGALSGGGVSVARSVLMAVAAMAALWRGRRGDDLRALGGSAIVLALAMPGVGEEAGFQLSYLAVGALILEARRARATREVGDRLAARSVSADRSARALEIVTLAARLTIVCWLVTSPVVAHHFQRISLVAPLANLLAAPIVSAVVISGLSALLLLPAFPIAGGIGIEVGAWLADLIVKLSKLLAAAPLAATTTPAPGAALTFVLTALVLAALLPPHAWKRRVAALLTLVAAALIADAAHDRWRSDRLDVWFASVGQGDAAVVRMPGGKVWVIDEGPPGRGRMVVAPLLRRAWIGRIDVLVASHVQSDHSGAMLELLEEFEVGEIWLPDGPCDNPAAAAIRGAALARGVPVHAISIATPPIDGMASVEILSPPRGAAPCNDNDQSLVLALSFAGRRILFTGDIEAAAEARLLETGALKTGSDPFFANRSATKGAVPVSVGDAAKTGSDPVLRADVLKVPHHGSRTSSTAAFLDAVAPRLAVASLGLDNQFHFPAPEVVSRYVERGIALLRTDSSGCVWLQIDADGALRVQTFRGGEVEIRNGRPLEPGAAALQQ